MKNERIYQTPFGFKIDLESVCFINDKISHLDKEFYYNINGVDNVVFFDNDNLDEAQSMLDDFITAWENYKCSVKLDGTIKS